MILEKNNFNAVNAYLALVLLLLMAQITLWTKTNRVKVELEVVPNAYSETTTKAFLFGDDEYYFRIKALKVQNMGDTFGRFTALYKYDYRKLYDWISMLDRLDGKSNYLASLSAYYFSQTQNKPDVRYVVDFLTQHARRDIENKWWWLYQAATLSQYVLKDRELTLSTLEILKNAPNGVLPLWLRQVVAVYFLNNGQDCESLRVLSGIEQEYKDLDGETDSKTRQRKEEQLDYMRHFIKNVVEKLKENKIDINKCLVR
jgi:hypothetical protein